MSANKIKAIILDIDGVIVGEEIGINSPNPNVLVSKKLKEVSQSGVPIYLCTAKPHFSIREIIDQIGLTNSHITDAGAVVIDPIKEKIDLAEYIPKNAVERIVEILISEGVYTEIYSIDDYYIEKSQSCDTTVIHDHILQKSSIEVNNLAKKSSELDIIKIMPIVNNVSEVSIIEELLDELKLQYQFNFSWGVHPVALPRQFGIITKQGVSKKEAAIKVFDNLNISFENILAVGDSTSDWKFMELCNFVGTVANADDKLKKLLVTKEQDNWFIGASVDENGILDILEHFNL